MSKTNIDIVKAYMKFFRDKSAETSIASTFADKYCQQSGGYIELANDFENIDIIKSKLEDKKAVHEKESEAYYDFLTSNISNQDGKTNIESLCDLTGLSENEILHPSTTPNQKWHLMISYLGMKQFHKKRPVLHMVSCPELWIWMFETSGECEIDKIENHAINYKLNQECDGFKYDECRPCNEWKRFLKEFRNRLHKMVVEEYLK